jgi:predicted lactoylglutathione lyase
MFGTIRAMSVPPRVSLATLGVTDVARATEFYETLGWRLSPASVPALVSYFETDGARLALVSTDDVTTHAGIEPRTSTDFRGTMLTISVDSTEAVDEALRAAVQAGAALIKAGVRTPRGGYLGHFTDPDGHLWSISYEPR